MPRGRGRARKGGVGSGRVVQGASHLLGVHSGGPPGAEDQQAGAGVRVQQASAVALAQSVHHAGLIEVHQRGQVFQTVAGGGVGLCEGTGGRALK